MKFKSVEEVLDFAITREQEAYDFYTDLEAKMSNLHTKNLFSSFAKEELGHKAKLEKVKLGGALKPIEKQVQMLNIADYMVDVEVTDDISYQDALIIAMKKEKAAFKLYNDLALAANEEGLINLFLALAQEEAKHKVRFEIEYDEKILTEN